MLNLSNRGLLYQQWIVVAILASVCVPTMATTSEGNADAKNVYDDTRRMACLQAMNSAFVGGDQSALSRAEWAIMDGDQMDFLEMTKNRTVIRNSSPDGQLLVDYKQACENSGGAFDIFTGVLDCVGYGKYSKGKATIDIEVNQAECFAPGPECSNYTSLDWYLDTKQVFQNSCTVRAGSLDNINDVISSLISSSESVMPPGEPNFVDTSAGYSDTRRRECLAAFKSEFNQYPDLQDAASHQAGKSQIELLQDSPIYTQREWYLNHDNSASLENYQQLCKEAGGTFDMFNGTLDCLGFGTKNKGRKRTTVTENAATCFPSTGCSDYTLGQWKIDTTLNMAHQSCTIRSSSTSEHDKGASSPLPITALGGIGDREKTLFSPPISDRESSGTNSQEGRSVTTIPLITVGLVIMAVGFVVVVSHRRRRHRHHAVECELSSSNFMTDDYSQVDLFPVLHDEEVELPSIN